MGRMYRKLLLLMRCALNHPPLDLHKICALDPGIEKYTLFE
jgi:hypothetical protein